MRQLDPQNLTELVEVADLAVRVASQLRRAANGKQATDVPAIEEGSAFLMRAIDGGALFTDGTYRLAHAGSLRPLNWAVDVYQAALGQPKTPTNYADINEFLTAVQKTLEELKETADPSRSAGNVPSALTFFERLGDLLSCQVDDALRQHRGEQLA